MIYCLGGFQQVHREKYKNLWGWVICEEPDSLQGIVPKQAIFEAVRVKTKSKYIKIEIFGYARTWIFLQPVSLKLNLKLAMLWAGLWKTIVCNVIYQILLMLYMELQDYSLCCLVLLCFDLVFGWWSWKNAYSVFWNCITLVFIFIGDHTNCSLKVSVQTLNFKFCTVL